MQWLDDAALRPSDDLDVARAQLLAAWPEGEPADPVRTTMLDFVDAHPDALARTCRPGHLTSSALVLATGRPLRTVLLHHRKAQRWFQPGGHADGDANLAGSALREATEETGCEGLRIAGPAIDLDIHRVTPPGESAHDHLDVRYLVVAPPGAVPVGNHESSAIGWFGLDELGPLGLDEGFLRLLRRGVAALSRLAP
jgi:8-oxo-dGTP pyrophosphatase MutT (NUDIX family)